MARPLPRASRRRPWELDMIQLKRLSVVLALLPLACNGDDVRDEGADGATEAGDGDGDTTGMEAEGMEAEAEGDGDPTTGDGDPTTGDGDGDPTTGDGDGDPTTGDGDGDPTTGDGDGDPTTGDGDGDPTTGDGDGDPTTGDGDGDPTTGDGDGDPTTGDGDGDPTTGDGDGDTGQDTQMACDEFQVVLEPIHPNVMLVLDKSRSMFVNYWDHDNNVQTPTITRWNSLYQVVNSLTTNFDTSINFGANLFPSVQAQNVYGPNACITSDFPEVTVGPGNGPAILATIPPANTVNSYGGTPATIGIDTAYNHLLSLNPAIPRFMILITDGAANCNQDAMTNFDLFEVYDTDLPALVGQAWNNDDIATYVVGINIANMIVNDGIGGDPNNINPSMKLNEVAQAGGTGVFYNSQNQAQLLTALQNVINSVQSCNIPLDTEPVFEEYTKVIIDGMEWPMVMNCANEDGWMYTNQMGPYDEIVLCGDACDSLKMVGEAQVEYYCNPG
jgi:hypothetical protein